MKCYEKSVTYNKYHELLFILFMMSVFFFFSACAGTSSSKSDAPADTGRQAAKSQAPSQSVREETSSTAAATTKVIQVEPLTTLVLKVKANLRGEPNDKGKIITRLKKGEKVFKLGDSGHWFHVELADKTIGWVLKKQTKEEK